MMRLKETLLRWGEWAARPLDETAWRRRRGRAIVWLFLAAGALALQTAIVQSPDYMINGLYHNRRAITLQLHLEPKTARAKLMERLCLSRSLFELGGSDPYQIPDAQACADRSRGKPIDGAAHGN